MLTEALHDRDLHSGSARTAEQMLAGAAENEVLAAAIELQSQLDRTDSLDQACHDLAGRMLQILNADRVIIVWRADESSPMRVMADTQPDESKQSIAMIAAAGEELAVRYETVCWAVDKGVDQRGATMAIEQFARTASQRTCVAGCLTDADEVPRGGLIVIDGAAPNCDSFVRAIAPCIAGKLAAIQRLQPGNVEMAWRSLRTSIESSKHVKNGLIGLAGFVLLMLAPATYTIKTPFELQPVTRRFVAVPVDGPLKKCFVRPGDVVTEGELLAEIDPMDLDYELAGLRSQLDQAVQARKGHIAEQDFAAGQLAALETQRLGYQTAMLGGQRDKLELRSPVDGMIVSGDWRSSEGIPLTRGETLFEVAPLHEMIVELWIPETEYHHVREGMTTRFATHADPDSPMVGTIVRVYPKAELRDHDNVFLAEVRVENSDGRFQPGMRGRATVYSDRHSIGWNWLHKPWHAARSMMGW